MCEPERESERASVDECEGGKGTENDTERKWESANGRERERLACVCSSFERSCYFSKFYTSRVISRRDPESSTIEERPECRPMLSRTAAKIAEFSPRRAEFTFTGRLHRDSFVIDPLR